MSNWPLVAATRYETLGAGTGTGTTVTSGAADTKGSYATIGTAGFAYSGIILSLANIATSTRYRLDIAVNTGGADDIIVEDFYLDNFTTESNAVTLSFPVSVPSGASVKVRWQGNQATKTAVAVIVGIAKDFPGTVGSRVVSCTDFTNTLPSNTVALNGTTFTAWTTIRASTPKRISQLYLSHSMGGDTTRTTSNILVEIGIGAAAAEVALFQFLGRNFTVSTPNVIFGPVPCDIPVGKRLAFRAQCSAAAADTYGVSAAGLAA